MPVVVAALVITGLKGVASVIVKFALPLPPGLAALMLAVNVPLTVGVPDIRPVDVLTLSPAGRLLAPNRVGACVAVIW